jgi:hypothetical protein
MKRISIGITIALTLLLVSEAYSFNPPGHETVGAIADELLRGKPAAEKIREMLDGLTLAEAAVLPDKIKAWDRRAEGRKETFRLPDHPVIEKQLREFWNANPPTDNDPFHTPSHKWFHYTDVPIRGKKYAQGKTGRSQWDIVQMIPYGIRVLTGQEKEDNDRKITKPIAIILLAHFVGDIHQPLHVGAAYFSQTGKQVNPDAGKQGFSTDGGNTITVDLADIGGGIRGHKKVSLHSFWDGNAVTTALGLAAEEAAREFPGESGPDKVIQYLAAREPIAWRPGPRSDPIRWAELWADEMLPIAAEAHGRLHFVEIRIEHDEHRSIAKGTARAKPRSDGVTYEKWAGIVTKHQMHKAGWRLALLLEQIVR